MIVGRRGFLKGLAALVAVPAIVRATSLMPVKKAAEALGMNDAEFATSDLLVRGYERFSFSYVDWRGLYLSFPTQHDAVFARL